MLKAKLIITASVFFALSAFAAYEIETQGTTVIIKKDGIVVQTVQQSQNQEYLKTITSLINNIKEVEATTRETVAELRESGMDEMAAQTEADAQVEIKMFEKTIEVEIKLLK